MKDEPLPSIPILAPERVVHHTTRTPKDLGPIRAWRSTDIEEQEKLRRQSKDEETYWNLRMKNRP
jgi:hypothetical protein